MSFFTVHQVVAEPRLESQNLDGTLLKLSLQDKKLLGVDDQDTTAIFHLLTQLIFQSNCIF